MVITETSRKRKQYLIPPPWDLVLLLITEKNLAVDISAVEGRIVPGCISRTVSGNVTFYRHWNESNFFFQITFFIKDFKITLLILNS